MFLAALVFACFKDLTYFPELIFVIHLDFLQLALVETPFYIFIHTIFEVIHIASVSPVAVFDNKYLTRPLEIVLSVKNTL